MAYGYATWLAILDKDGKLKEIVATHDMERVMNSINGAYYILDHNLISTLPMKGTFYKK